MEKKSEGKLEECKGNITLENRKKNDFNWS